jgi:DNA-directed RNA polymerase specialized sigma24 family protein
MPYSPSDAMQVARGTATFAMRDEILAALSDGQSDLNRWLEAARAWANDKLVSVATPSWVPDLTEEEEDSEVIVRLQLFNQFHRLASPSRLSGSQLKVINDLYACRDGRASAEMLRRMRAEISDPSSEVFQLLHDTNEAVSADYSGDESVGQAEHSPAMLWGEITFQTTLVAALSQTGINWVEHPFVVEMRGAIADARSFIVTYVKQWKFPDESSVIDDSVQEVYLRTLLNYGDRVLPAWDETQMDVKRWFIGIAKSIVAKLVRERAASLRKIEVLNLDQLPGREASSTEGLHNKEMYALVLNRIEALPTPQRAAMRRRYLGDVAADEPRSTRDSDEVLCRRALRRLRLELRHLIDMHRRKRKRG